MKVIGLSGFESLSKLWWIHDSKVGSAAASKLGGLKIQSLVRKQLENDNLQKPLIKKGFLVNISVFLAGAIAQSVRAADS